MRLSVLTLALAMLPIVEPDPELLPPPRDIKEMWEGYYSVTGTEKGKKYHGIAVLTPHGEVYGYQCVAAGTTSQGVATKKNNILAISWTFEAKPGVRVIGATLLERTAEGFKGQWCALPTDGNNRTEEWRYLRPLDEE